MQVFVIDLELGFMRSVEFVGSVIMEFTVEFESSIAKKWATPVRYIL
jgi:hypothetical protein